MNGSQLHTCWFSLCISDSPALIQYTSVVKRKVIRVDSRMCLEPSKFPAIRKRRVTIPEIGRRRRRAPAHAKVHARPIVCSVEEGLQDAISPLGRFLVCCTLLYH